MKKEYRIEIIDSPSMALCNTLSEQQKIVWEISDVERMPPWKIFITPRIGGLLIIAFDQESPVAHAVFTHAHETLSSKPYLYLDMIGILPEYQSHQIGEQIILKSKEFAGNNGYRSIQWTFDPLEGANANLYVRKLGATVSTFYPDYYGELTGKRQQGMPTDRFLAKLEPDARTATNKDPEVTITQQDYNQYESMIAQDPKTVAIEFPADLHAILSSNQEKAQSIRKSTASIFTTLFNQGYCINGFFRKGETNYYIAVKVNDQNGRERAK